MDDFADVMTAAFDGAEEPAEALPTAPETDGEAAGETHGEPAEAPSLDDNEPLFIMGQVIRQSSAPSSQMTLSTHSGQFAYTVPTGFTGWGD